MRYIVTFNMYVKALNTYHNMVKSFDKLPDALIYMSKFDRLKEWESITVHAEK